jgi:hypothetical protein
MGQYVGAFHLAADRLFLERLSPNNAVLVQFFMNGCRIIVSIVYILFLGSSQ